jgi:hypothetical protein
VQIPETSSREIAAETAGLTRTGALRAVLVGTLIAGTLDIFAAIVTWMLRGVSATRVLQGVASGLLGREAVNGGAASAALGLLLHFLVMSVIVAVFYFLSRKRTVLTTHWVVSGVLYGVAVYLVMTFIVVPLSAAPMGLPTLAAAVQGVLVHIFCVGLPIAFVAGRL